MNLKKPKRRPRKNRGFGRNTKSPNEAKYQGDRWRTESRAFLEQGGTIPIKQKNGYRFVKQCVGYGKNPKCKRAAVTTDHIKNPVIHEGVNFWDKSNWQGMCRSCHALKSIRERAGQRKQESLHRRRSLRGGADHTAKG